jgi:alpha-tubulin suppressor-like RCC1 family protein
VLGDGSMSCWGADSYGQLGYDGTGISNVPVSVSNLEGAIAATAGYAHTCAVLGDGAVRCWGYNLSGQIGNGETPWSALPVPVTGSPFTEQIFAHGFD